MTCEFLPHVTAADALVVHPVGHAVDRHLHFSDVGIEVGFRIPGTGCVWVDEQQQDTLERSALGVYPQGEVGVRASVDGLHPFAHDEVVRELFAGLIRTHRLGGQGLTSNDLILHLDVFQIVPELGDI